MQFAQSDGMPPVTDELRTKRYGTDEADRYFTHHAVKVPVPMDHGIMFNRIELLPHLKGRPWNNDALNWVLALRPSAIRVTTGLCTCDSYTWRVTVLVEDDGRTIRSISQEVACGAYGLRCGADLAEYAAPLNDGPMVFVNTRAIARLQLDDKEK